MRPAGILRAPKPEQQLPRILFLGLVPLCISEQRCVLAFLLWSYHADPDLTGPDNISTGLGLVTDQGLLLNVW